jgi:hydrogenase expression/formation protein HypC
MRETGGTVDVCLAVPGRVVGVRGKNLLRTGRVEFGGVERVVSLACVPEARVDDYVLVHAGIAIARIDERAARETLEFLALTDETTAPEEPEP